MAPGSIHPGLTGIEAGLSATGDIFDAIAGRARTTVASLSEGLDACRAVSTGLLRLNWDNGDRTVLVNPELSGVTFGWRLTSTARDEFFAAIESSGFHTRIVIDRMEEYGGPVDRIVNAGGIPQKNATLNRVYANVLNKTVLAPERDVTVWGRRYSLSLSRMRRRRRFMRGCFRCSGSCISNWASGVLCRPGCGDDPLEAYLVALASSAPISRR